MSACKRASQLVGVRVIAITLGIGGFGHLAVQILSALQAATIVEDDREPEALTVATGCGANTSRNSTSVIARNCLTFGSTYIVVGVEGSISATTRSRQ